MVLQCYFEKELVGTLFDDSQGFGFRYSDSWLSKEHRFPLSLSIPLNERIYRSEAYNYFYHLLPSEEIVERVCFRKKVNPKNLIDKLEVFGQECSGAFCICTELDEVATSKKNELQKIPFEALDEFLEYDWAEIGGSFYEQKLSMAGAQDKMPVIYTDGDIYYSTKLTPSTHLLKFPVLGKRSLPNICLNEYICGFLGAHSGMSVVDMEVKTFQKKRMEYYLFSKRYDRTDTFPSMRLHQEDLCQANNVLEKYEERPGGITLQQVVDTLQKCSVPAFEMRRFFDWLVFNVIIRNGDNHGKNLSILYKNNTITLAPFYDMVSTGVYGRTYSNTMAFAVGDCREPGEMSLKKWEALQPFFGYSSSQIRHYVQEMCEGVFHAVQSVDLSNSSQGSKDYIGKIFRVIYKQLKVMK